MKPNPKSATPNANGYHLISARLTGEQYRKLEHIRAARGLRSLNAAICVLVDEVVIA